jgi:hypothetical protein
MSSDASSREDCGVCAAEPPPIVGSVLTGTGLTLAAAARALDRGEAVALTDVQRRLVERWMAERAFG